LEFQLPRQWAPVFGELALGPDRKQQSNASLQFSLMGPKLYVNTSPVMLLPWCEIFMFCFVGFLFLSFVRALNFIFNIVLLFHSSNEAHSIVSHHI